LAPKKIVIITGASKGIGKAIVLKLAEDKSFVLCLFSRNKLKLKSLQKLITKKNVISEYYVGDVADEVFVNQSVNEIKKKYKKIDILINNAGIAYFEQFVDSSLEHFKTQINTNVIGVYNFTKAVIDNMIKRKNGSIINIVSQAGKMGFSYGTAYAATKHAVMGFSKSLMLEVRKHNIRVITVCPGSVETGMIENSPIHKNIKQVLKPHDIAEIVAAAIYLPNRALISEIDIRPTNP
jgi:3-oxoacyl-[acyl-carrier protein] reductase